MPKLEIAALTLADAIAAQEGGADSIEISRDLSVGGLTPDFDLVRQIRDAVTIGVNVMIRPHADSFIYSESDVETILDNACTLAHLGVDGVVFGALTPDRHLDLALIEQVASEAIPLALTVHRALDESVEPEQALAGLVGVIPRVLTSGPASDAWSGRVALGAVGARLWRQVQFRRLRRAEARTYPGNAGAGQGTGISLRFGGADERRRRRG